VTFAFGVQVYHFRVRAKNALGYSEWSDESMFETLPPPPPEPPLACSVLATHNSVTINWLHNQVRALQLRGAPVRRTPRHRKLLRESCSRIASSCSRIASNATRAQIV